MRFRGLLCLFLISAGATCARAQTDNQDQIVVNNLKAPTTAQNDVSQTPTLVRWMFNKTGRNIQVIVPILATDPNSGTSVGIMPIIVKQRKNSDDIESITAPSITENQYFGPEGTYRYYYFPNQYESFTAIGTIGKYENEALIEYKNLHLENTDTDIDLRLHKNTNAGGLFYGIGSNSAYGNQSSYISHAWSYNLTAGHSLFPDSHWRVEANSHLLSERVSNGVIPGMPGIKTEFNGFVPNNFEQVQEGRLSLEYDSRDSPVTTTKGAFLQAYSGYSVAGIASSYNYDRYGIDGRYFYPWPNHPDNVLAFQVQGQQLYGSAPFWLLPELGGKYSLRAYAYGRYVDNGMYSVNIEQRFKVYEAKMAGVPTELELAPFAGIGSVFADPTDATARYSRPVFGTAIRAIARPQVVGSLDFGVGQEGLVAFMDINYAF